MTKDEKKENGDKWWRKYTKRHLEPDKKKKEVEVIDDPFSLTKMHRLIDNVFTDFFDKDFFRIPKFPRIKMDEGLFRKPLVDVEEIRDKIILRVELPGVDKKDIKIKIDDGNLIIDAQTRQEKKTESSYSSSYNGFRNVLRLPAEVEKDTSRAKFENGVLIIELKKKYPSDGYGEITIE